VARAAAAAVRVRGGLAPRPACPHTVRTPFGHRTRLRGRLNLPDLTPRALHPAVRFLVWGQGVSAAPRRLLVSSDALKAGEASDMGGGVANPVYLTSGPSAAPAAAAAATPAAAPAVAATPSPAVVATPSPAVAATPSPAVAATPSPAVAATPSPAVAATPSPAVAATPSPAVAATPTAAPAAAPAVPAATAQAAMAAMSGGSPTDAVAAPPSAA
jgi:hypothetical protein